VWYMEAQTAARFVSANRLCNIHTYVSANIISLSLYFESHKMWDWKVQEWKMWHQNLCTGTTRIVDCDRLMQVLALSQLSMHISVLAVNNFCIPGCVLSVINY